MARYFAEFYRSLRAEADVRHEHLKGSFAYAYKRRFSKVSLLLID